MDRQSYILGETKFLLPPDGEVITRPTSEIQTSKNKLDYRMVGTKEWKYLKQGSYKKQERVASPVSSIEMM